jgi:hypothetical protein
MNQVATVFLGLAAVATLAFLWVLEFQRERQLRAMQGQRMMKSLQEALLRENSADHEGNVGIARKPSAILGSSARNAKPANRVELSLVLYSHRQM